MTTFDHAAPLAGRKALVTGGTRGIGRAIAERLALSGAAVTVTGTAPGCSVPGFDCMHADFSDRKNAEAFFADARAAGFDILVNNAGINAIAPFELIDPADFDRIWEVNLRSAFRLCQAVLPGMRARGWGRIVNVSSVFGIVSREYRASYSASKFGLDGMTAALSAEAARFGVLANCVAPGFIDTDLTRRVLGEDGMAELAGRIPAGRLGGPEEVAALVAWLAGPENTYLTGQNIAIDGGFTRV